MLLHSQRPTQPHDTFTPLSLVSISAYQASPMGDPMQPMRGRHASTAGNRRGCVYFFCVVLFFSSGSGSGSGSERADEGRKECDVRGG